MEVPAGVRRQRGLQDEAFPQQPAGVGFRAGVLGKADSDDEHSYAGCFRGRWSVSDSKAAERGGRSAGVLRYYDASACSDVCEHRGHGIGFEKALLIEKTGQAAMACPVEICRLKRFRNPR